MLQQILRDMYVDPEILAELPEEQKEILFLKIREEQVRRYHEVEKKEKLSNTKPAKNNKKGKRVCFLQDGRGEPWTWVFGEEGETAEQKWAKLYDKKTEAAIDAIIKEDMALKPRGTLNKATTGHGKILPLEKKVVRNSPNLAGKKSPSATPPQEKREIQYSPSSVRKISPCLSRKEMKKSQSLRNLEKKDTVHPGARPITPPKHMANQPNTHILNRPNPIKQASMPIMKPTQVKIKEITKPPKSKQTTQKTKHSPTNENVYESFEPMKVDHVVSNEEWEKQLMRFKKEDERRSFRARRASIEVRRQSIIAMDRSSTFNAVKERVKRLSSDKNQSKPSEKPRPIPPPKPNNIRLRHPLPIPGKAMKPTNRKEVIEWFQETQMETVWAELKEGLIPEWFHGIIGRMESESHLSKTGDYLIRLSDKMWGYALSYRTDNRIKHFLIDASEPQCFHFFGNDQIRHESLTELIEYHKVEPITQNGEILKHAAGQSDIFHPDYSNLMLKDDKDTRL